MEDAKKTPAGSEPPPGVTYKHPRRASPENSITLRHHRLAREASRRHSPVVVPKVSIVDSPRRNSSDESNETGISDPKRWFDRSNENPNAAVNSSMDVDPPFYQKETDSSNEEGQMVPSQSPAYKYVQSRNTGLLRPDLAHSSSADDYRSVIDDLTIENIRLREELKRYRQMGPESMRREKLFEVKVHGLPSRKKRELEAALRDFTTSLDGSSTGVSTSRKKEKGKSKESLTSKHAAPSSSGSNSRPHATDSAYASMSTGAASSGPSLPRRVSRQGSNQDIERYLQEVPEGLWPRSNILTEKDKKKVVVRRLEQLFTGKGLGKAPLVPPAINEDVPMAGTDEKAPPPPAPLRARAPPSVPAPPPPAPPPVLAPTSAPTSAPTPALTSIPVPPSLPSNEASREAQILPRASHHKESHSRDNVSSNSNGDQTDSRDTGNGSGRGSGSGRKEGDNSPPNAELPEQRPTRLRDLDPDRPQVPSENMDYIRHLGLVAPQSRQQFSSIDVSPDAEGWVYLNLLCNLAQLHMLNVTPAFIRSAVSEKSRHFQLSPDGRKIRWRGGVENTKFTSDSSGSNSRGGNTSPESDGSNARNQRKKQKTQSGSRVDGISEPSKFKPQVSSSSAESFHYKPLFARNQTPSSDEQPSPGDDSESSCTPLEESNVGMNSRWNHSGVSGVSQRKRRRDGAIIYYTGAPFCTDLSGDLGEVSTDSLNLRSLNKSVPSMQAPKFSRSTSGSSIPFKPLSNYVSHRAMMDLDFAPIETTPSDDCDDETDKSDELEAEFPWSTATQIAKLVDLKASGLGGIAPEDHFIVFVTTRRPRSIARRRVSASRRPQLTEHRSNETAKSRDTAESIAGRLAVLSTTSPGPLRSARRRGELPLLTIEYTGGKVRRLPPVSLPPPSFFFGSSDQSISNSEDSISESYVGGAASRRLLSRPGQALSPNEDLSSNDEEDEHLDDAAENNDSLSAGNTGEAADDVTELKFRRQRGERVSDLSKMTTGSSVATAGGVASGYSSTGDV